MSYDFCKKKKKMFPSPLTAWVCETLSSAHQPTFYPEAEPSGAKVWHYRKEELTEKIRNTVDFSYRVSTNSEEWNKCILFLSSLDRVPVAVRKHHDQKELAEQGFIWLRPWITVHGEKLRNLNGMENWRQELKQSHGGMLLLTSFLWFGQLTLL